jgi:hypothetical protein
MIDLALLLCPAVSNDPANIFSQPAICEVVFFNNGVFISGYVGLLLDQGQQKLHR